MNKKNSGVVLIEVCLVCVLIVIICALSWPALSKYAGQYKLELAIKSVVYTFRYTRDKAMNTGKRYSVEFDAINNKYTPKIESDQQDKPGEFEPIPDKLSKQRTLPDGIQISAISAKNLVFNPDGTSDDFSLSLKNIRSQVYTLRMLGITGSCDIKNEN